VVLIEEGATETDDKSTVGRDARVEGFPILAQFTDGLALLSGSRTS
jgi:hypothetical protein